jgi:hypothetical protein
MCITSSLSLKLITETLRPEPLKFKIFETNIIDELNSERESSELNSELNGELEDFFENDIILIPIFTKTLKSQHILAKNRCLIFVIEMNPEDILVKLYCK